MTLFVGRPKHEQRLELEIPPGTTSGAVYRFPGQGPVDPRSGGPATLAVHIFIDKETKFQQRFAPIQITAGIVLILLGLMWLSFFSEMALLLRLVLAAFVGGVGGALAGEKRWRLGLLCGLIGGAVSFILQELYYFANYWWYGRLRFWNYEMVLLLMISLLPGFGLYYWLFKRKQKRSQWQTKPQKQ
jgi:hypothetical protein